jgi:hypothetical protein
MFIYLYIFISLSRHKLVAPASLDHSAVCTNLCDFVLALSPLVLVVSLLVNDTVFPEP